MQRLTGVGVVIALVSATIASGVSTVEQMEAHPEYAATFNAVEAWADEFDGTAAGASGSGTAFPYGAYVLSKEPPMSIPKFALRAVFGDMVPHAADIREDYDAPNEPSGCLNSLHEVALGREVPHVPAPVVAFYYYCLDRGNSSLWTDRMHLLLPLDDDRYVSLDLRESRERPAAADDSQEAEAELQRRISQLDVFLGALGVCAPQPQPGGLRCDGSRAPGSFSPTSAASSTTPGASPSATTPAGSLAAPSGGGFRGWWIALAVGAAVLAGGATYWVRARAGGQTGTQPDAPPPTPPTRPETPPSPAPDEAGAGAGDAGPAGPGEADAWRIVRVKRPPGGG